MRIEEESLPQAWGRLLQLLNALPDHSLKKNEILDIFYNGLTDASRDHLDSCASCVFRERVVEQAELLSNNILSNDFDWALPEPIPKPTPKKRVSHKLGGRFPNYLMLCLIILLRKMKYLISFIMD